MTLETVLVPLHPTYDTVGGMTDVSVIAGFVIRTEDASKTASDVISALKRVCDKWRLFAGRLERDQERAAWQVRVPVGPLPSEYSTFTLTKTNLSDSEDFTRSAWAPGTAATFNSPPVSMFCHPSTPSSLKSVASQKRPPLSLHISTNSSKIMFVGLTFPHGLCDATGMGMIIKFLHCELNGQEWTPPPISTTSALVHAISALQEKAADSSPTSPVSKLSEVIVAATFWSIVAFVLSLAREFLWERATLKEIFIGKEIWEPLVAREKEAALNAGDEWISSGDIMVAFLIKSAYKNELRKNLSITLASAYGIRTILSSATSHDLSTYAHNAIHLFKVPTLTVGELQALPLHRIALLHRQYLNKAVSPPSVLRYVSESESLANTTPNQVPVRKFGEPTWAISNQVSAKMTEISFGKGTEVAEYWVRVSPFQLDHIFYLNNFCEGALMTGAMRKSEWASVEDALQELRK